MTVFFRVYVYFCGWLAYGLAIFFLFDEAIKANQSGDTMAYIASYLLMLANMLWIISLLRLTDRDDKKHGSQRR